MRSHAYVFAIALNSTGAPAEAMAPLEQAHRQHPTDRDLLTAVVSIARDTGDLTTAAARSRAGDFQPCGHAAPLAGVRTSKNAWPINRHAMCRPSADELGCEHEVRKCALPAVLAIRKHAAC
jgi:hypothetical protein